MRGDVLAAVRARAPQSATLLVIAALLAAAAAAGPWYARTVTTRAATTVIDSTSAAQRTITLHQSVPINGDPDQALATFADRTASDLPIPGAEPVLGLSRDKIAYRADFCDTTKLTGTCPTAAGEIAVGAAIAERLRLTIGSTLTDPVKLRVVATYEPGTDDLLHTAAATFADPRLAEADATYQVTLPAAAIRGDGGYDVQEVLNRAATRAKIDNPTGPTLDAVRTQRTTIQQGVLIALGQVLVLGWLAAGLAGRSTGRDRRTDAALLKLRGGTRLGVLRLALGQHLVSLLGGAVIGAPLGVLAAYLLAGGAPVRADLQLTLLLGAAAVGGALVIALVVLAIIDVILARGPVAVLLRRIRVGRRDWRADVADLALIAVAAGAVVQARSATPDSGLGSVAPALVALAVALVLARLLGLIADRAGGAALRAGRLPAGLTAVQVSRQPGTDRVFALAVVAVALATTTAGGLAAARAERADRAAQELGAARVLTVQTTNVTHLLYAVHQVDPAGKQAQAVVVDRSASPPLLLRSSPASRNRLPLIAGSTLALTVNNNRTAPADLALVLQHEGSGIVIRVAFPPVASGEHTVSASAPECATAPGCRLVRWQLVGAGSVNLRKLEPLAANVFSDPSLWHTSFTGTSAALSTTAQGLHLTSTAEGDTVWAADTPLPVPIELAGANPSTWRLTDPTVVGIGTQAIPVRVTRNVSSLPVVGSSGIAADLDTARRIAAESSVRGETQVWLTGDSAAVVPKLRELGVVVVSQDTTADRARRCSHLGSDATGRFAAFTVAIALLLAAATTAVAAMVDRKPLTETLRFLRTQGLSSRTAVIILYAAPAALALTAVLGGLVAAAVAVPLAVLGS